MPSLRGEFAESLGGRLLKRDTSIFGRRPVSKILQSGEEKGGSKLFNKVSNAIGPKTKILVGVGTAGTLNYYFGGGDDSFAGGIIKDIKNAALVVKIIFFLVIGSLIAIVGYNLLSLLVSLFKSLKKSSKKSDPQEVFNNPTYAVPDSEFGTVEESQTGGGKNNLDKYMYCLILLLGLGIHHLYDSYNTKKDKYLDLLKEKEEYDKLF